MPIDELDWCKEYLIVITFKTAVFKEGSITPTNFLNIMHMY